MAYPAKDGSKQWDIHCRNSNKLLEKAKGLIVTIPTVPYQ